MKSLAARVKFEQTRWKSVPAAAT